MFTPKLNTSRARNSPFARNQSPFTDGKTRRLSLQGYTPDKTRRAPRRSANVSLQSSMIVEQTSEHALELFGTALPVQVSEAINIADRSAELSVKFESSGWAGLICTGKVYVWKYKSTQIGKTSICRELGLPPSDMGHKSDLMTIFNVGGDNQSTSCLIVTCEGVVRFWINISHAGAFSETNIDVKGQEFSQLIQLSSGQCIVVTTTNSMVLITPTAQGQISYKVVKEPSSMAAGIGRRMSSFIFGASTPLGSGLKFRRIMLGEILQDGSQSVYVLAGTLLTKWAIHNNSERLLYQCNVDLLFQECISNAIWNQNVLKMPGLKTWMVDMSSTRDGVVILGAAVNEEIGPEIRYALGTLHTEGTDPPQSFLSFNVSTYTELLEDNDERLILRHKITLPDPNTSSVYMYDKKTILCLTVSNNDGSGVDKVEFQSPCDRILGAGVYNNEALFFSHNHGIVSMKVNKSQTEIVTEQSINESIMEQSSFLHEQSTFGLSLNKVEELSISEDKTARVKAAFFHFLKGNLELSHGLVEEMFGSIESNHSAALDEHVIALSHEMINDFPASDPRWAESVPQDGSSSSGSMILLHQLEDKLKAHEYYINFLKQTNIWDRLSTVRILENEMSTHLALCEHAEKLVAAMALRNLHLQHRNIVDQAVRQVLEQRNQTVPPSGLTPQDVFYREVSKIEDILESLQTYESDELGTDIAASHIYSTVSIVNSIFCRMLHDAWQYRTTKAAVYHSANQTVSSIPWTAAGSHGVRLLLSRQHQVTIDAAIPVAQDSQQRGALLQQLLELTDILLDGYKSELEAVRLSSGEKGHYQELKHRYETDRRTYIAPFVTLGQHERAASLAEKYCDFATLVQLCEDTNNEERLNRYMNQFQGRGFHDFVFKYYMEEGRRGKLLSSLMSSHPQLGRLLNTEGNEYLSWLHNINTNNFWKTHETLQQLAMNETECVSKKKTLLSISKLAALASDESQAQVATTKEALNEQLDLILHQETLPEEVVTSLGMDPENMKVLTPKQLIELYTSDYNKNSNCFDFKKALDLLQFIDKTDNECGYEPLLLHIWCQAILKDRWMDISTDDPFESCKDTVFFQTLELAYTEGMDLREYLPGPEKILEASELGDLAQEANFQYLIKAGYEQIQRILSIS